MIFFRRRWRGLIAELQDVDRQLQLASIKSSLAQNLIHDKKRRASFFSNVTVITAMHGLPVTPDMLGSLYIRDTHNTLRSAIKKLKWIYDKIQNDPKYFKIIKSIEILIRNCEELLKILDPRKLIDDINNIRAKLRNILVEVEEIEFMNKSF